MKYVILSAPSGSGLREAIGKIRQSESDIEIVDVEDTLCGMHHTEEALEEAGVSPPEDGQRRSKMYDITWNLSRSKIIELWEIAVKEAIHKLKKSNRSLKILSCHMLYFCGNKEEFYSPINPSFLKNQSYYPSHILLLIDDVYDMYLRLTRKGALFDPKTRIPALQGRIKEEEGTDLSTLIADKLKFICSEWQIGIMAHLLYWRNIEITIAEQLALQFRSNFIVWGTKQLTAVPILWMKNKNPISIYLSHPISRPRRMYKKTGKWDRVVNQFNSLQSELLEYNFSCVMPSAIDEYRIKKKDRKSNLMQRVPLLEERWPLPGKRELILYSSPIYNFDINHTNILSYKKWSFKNKEFINVKNCSKETSETINTHLRVFEGLIEKQVSSRDHMFVSWTNGILVFRPLFSEPVWSSGVRAEIRHWALIARSDRNKRIVFLHFTKDVLGLINYHKQGRISTEKNNQINDELISIISKNFNLDSKLAKDIFRYERRGGREEMLEKCPVQPTVAHQIQNQFPELEKKAKEIWLEKKLVAHEVPLVEVKKEQIEYYIVGNMKDLKNNYSAICDFLKTGNKSIGHTEMLKKLIRNI